MLLRVHRYLTNFHEMSHSFKFSSFFRKCQPISKSLPFVMSSGIFFCHFYLPFPHYLKNLYYLQLVCIKLRNKKYSKRILDFSLMCAHQHTLILPDISKPTLRASPWKQHLFIFHRPNVRPRESTAERPVSKHCEVTVITGDHSSPLEALPTPPW